MQNTFNENEVLARFLDLQVDRLAGFASGFFNQAHDAVRSRLKIGYKPYLKRIIARHSQAKSFLIRDAPVPLYSFYVPLDVESRKSVLGTPGFNALSKLSPRLVITGTAGSGKTIFIWHLLLSCVAEGNRIPILIELRRLNKGGTKLLSTIEGILEQDSFPFDAHYIRAGLENGHFAVFLDGLDEVTPNRRKTVTSQIHSLSSKYPNNLLFVSSRPDSTLSGWDDFQTVSLCPLSLEKACAVIDSSPVETDIKVQVLDDLRSGLFERHHSFLSNPLMLAIMLLTYHETAQIPEKLSIFYDHSYTALFQKHDALKSGFRRDRQTALDIREFERVFSALSLSSYDAGIVEFSETSVLWHIERASDLTGLNFKAEDFLADCLQAVCLLVEDGLAIVYPHRSFQEYFVARFISEASDEAQRALIKRFELRSESDNVYRLLFEMRQSVVEKEIVLPKIDALLSAVRYRGRINRTVALRYLQELVEEIRFDIKMAKELGPTTAVSGFGSSLSFVRLLCRLYGEPYRTALDPWPIFQSFNVVDELSIPVREIGPRSSYMRALDQDSLQLFKRSLDSLISLRQEVLERQATAKVSLSELLE